MVLCDKMYSSYATSTYATSTHATSNSDGMVCVGGGLCLTVSYWHRVEAWRLNFKTLTKR